MGHGQDRNQPGRHADHRGPTQAEASLVKRGKRRRRREARRLAGRIIDLEEQGHPPAVIASSTGLTEEFVREALSKAEEALAAEGGGES
jgi:hypothetical protein